MTKVKLFSVSSRADNLHGYRDVHISWFVDKRPRPLFGPGGSLNVAYRDAIKDYDESNKHKIYPEMALEERFTKDEVDALVQWLRIHRNDDTSIIKSVTLPIANNIIGYGAIPVGGPVDCLTVGESADYDLPFKVFGHFDVRGCVFDEALPGARRKLVGFRIVAGRIEPWFFDEKMTKTTECFFEPR